MQDTKIMLLAILNMLNSKLRQRGKKEFDHPFTPFILFCSDLFEKMKDCYKQFYYFKLELYHREFILRSNYKNSVNTMQFMNVLF
jgi:hypothetical protein